MKTVNVYAILAAFSALAGAAEMPDEAPESRSLGISYASLSLTGVSDSRFNPLELTLEAHLEGSVFGALKEDISVLVNETPVPGEHLRVADNHLSARVRLRTGLNEILVTALDQHGALLAADLLAWAGDRRLVVDVVDESMRPIERAEVELILADDHHVRLSSATVGGQAEFLNLPPEDMLLRVRSPGRPTVRTVLGPEQTSILITLRTE